MNPKNAQKLSPILRTLLEVSFIIFLFYSNLLMGELTHSGTAQSNGVLWAIKDIFTVANFTVAIISALIGHLFFSFLRRKL